MSNEIFRPEGYTLLFEDHFQGTELNRDNWFERTGEKLGGLNFAENVSVSDDNLHVLFSKIVENGKQIPTGGVELSRIVQSKKHPKFLIDYCAVCRLQSL